MELTRDERLVLVKLIGHARGISPKLLRHHLRRHLDGPALEQVLGRLKARKLVVYASHDAVPDGLIVRPTRAAAGALRGEFEICPAAPPGPRSRLSALASRVSPLAV